MIGIEKHMPSVFDLRSENRKKGFTMTAEMATSLDQDADLKFSQAPDLPSSITPPRTPTAMVTAAHKVFAEIQSIYDALIKLSSLAPGLQINSLLTRLVDLCASPHSPDISNEILRLCVFENLCENLRPLCGAAEGCLESYWAQHIISETKSSVAPVPLSCSHACTILPGVASVRLTKTSELPLSEKTRLSSSTPSSTSRTDPIPSLLTAFPYHQNYTDLTQLEVSSLSPYLASAPRSIAFIGSGPLPLTSICLQSHYPTAHILNIDRDTHALQTSQELCESVGCGARMGYASDDVSTLLEGGPDWKSFDLVFLAALVGMNSSSKISILASLASKLTPGTLVVARSARGVRTVLYPVRGVLVHHAARRAYANGIKVLELGEDLQNAGYQVLAEVHPWTEVVNSIVVLRVKAR